MRSPPQVRSIFLATDEDESGGIDYDEFASILKGVKVQSAATAIQRRARQRAGGGGGSYGRKRASPSGSPGGGAGGAGGAGGGGVAERPIKTVEELRRKLGAALLRRKINANMLVQQWDRGGNGTLSLMEFRVGMRETLGADVKSEVASREGLTRATVAFAPCRPRNPPTTHQPHHM